jgi:hypothetical protein
MIPDYARNVISGFARLGGETVGIIANNPLVLAGVLDIDAAIKASRWGEGHVIIIVITCYNRYHDNVCLQCWWECWALTQPSRPQGGVANFAVCDNWYV